MPRGEFTSKKETSEATKIEHSGITDTKPENGTTYEKASGLWTNLYAKRENVEKSEWGGTYVPESERFGRTLCGKNELGSYEGNRGNSLFIPSDVTERGRAAREKLAENNMTGIEYKNLEPDFSKCSKETVIIDHMTENRSPYVDKDGNQCEGNFEQADIKVAEKWNSSQKDGRSDWKPREVTDWRHDNNLSWHERCDTKTMDLVPREIHDFFSHSGGCAECKARDSVNVKGVFDE